jgi:hypothetical protein
MRDLMSSISEAKGASSWPDGWEHWIEGWTTGQRPVPAHLDTSCLRPDLDRLAVLRGITGGWLCYSRDRGRIEFQEYDEWRCIRASRRD